jgi:uncharacterized protein YbgA (DUF1722 family)/uncharacterized protein YbbK (DUF523 family)
VEDKVPLGISACLLGQHVRYNAGHKRDPYLVETLGRFVEWVPVCPEVELGMGAPREAVRLVQLGERIHMVGTESEEDWTDRMESFARRRIKRLPPLSGYVFKARSPSCGVFRVKLFGVRGGPLSSTGVGLFAAELRTQQPLLPVEEEGRLHDPVLRENFLERVFAFHRLRELLSGRFSLRRLAEFHTVHKLQVLSHSAPAYRELGRLVANARSLRPRELEAAYAGTFMRALEQEATPSKNANVLHHILGYFKRTLTADEKKEALGLIEDYRNGLLPLIVPVTLLKHFVRKYGEAYVGAQTYLYPHPRELMLRNHA